MQTNEPCPCQSGNAYENCCQAFHLGALPQTAAQLMRSRYCAFVLQNIPYIIASTAPSQQPLLDAQALADWAQNTQWLGLEVLPQQTLDKTHAVVEFKAYFQSTEGKQTHHENSLFVNIDGRWYFVDPTVPLPSNKQPCLCGSGKKFKHCCGGWL